MTNWRKKIKIRNLFTEKEDAESVRKSMNEVADVLKEHREFKHLIQELRNIPDGDEYFTPCDYANKILNKIYNVADEERIWID